MRYAIIGATISGNKGAASMLEATIQQLGQRDPGAHFDLLTVYPLADAAQNTHANVTVLDASPVRLGVFINGASLLHRCLPVLRKRIETALPEVEAIANADVFLDEGGITFVDGRGKFLIYNVATILPPLLTKTPVVKVAQAMGPFDQLLNGACARALLPLMARIVARGDVTLGFLRSLGLNNVVRGTDAAFALSVTPDSARRGDALLKDLGVGESPLVGYSPSVVLAKAAAKTGEDYLGTTVASIDYITNVLELPVLIVAHSARTGTHKTHNNDLPLCRAIYSQVARPELVHFIDEELSAQELRHVIGRCDVFIASRFHAMVSALASGVPTMVIGWSHKYGEVLADFDLEGLSISAQDATVPRVSQMVTSLVADKDALRARIDKAMGAVIDRADQQFDLAYQIASGRAHTRV